MKRLHIILLLSFVCCWSVCATDEADILTKISANGTAITTIESHFVQRKHVKAFKNDVLSSGRFYYQKDDKICMAYERPKGDLLLMNADEFVMIVDGKRSAANAQSNPMLKQMRTLLTACVSGDFERLKSGRNAKISVTETEKNYILTTIFEGSAKKYYANIVLTFDKGNLSLLTLRMNEANGNFTEYTFDRPIFNQKIDAKIFNTENRVRF